MDPRVARVHLAPERLGSRDDRPGFVSAWSDAASVTVVAVASAPQIPVTITTATVPVTAVVVPVAAIEASSVVPVGAMPVAVAMVVAARQAEA